MLRNMGIVTIDIEFIEYLPHLEEIDLSENSIQMAVEPTAIWRTVIQLYKMTKLRRMIFQKNSHPTDYNPDCHPLSKKMAKLEYAIPIGLEEIDFAHSRISGRAFCLDYGLRLQRNNKLTILDLSHMKVIKKLGPLLGMVYLKALYFQDNQCFIHPTMFSCVKGAFESLEVLNVAHNFINISEANNTLQLFQNCSRLQHLDLSYNNMGNVPSTMLRDAANVKSLNLSGNNLRDIDLDLDGAVSLETLNISQNYLKILPKSLLVSIENQKEGSILIDIQGNSLDCGCNSIEFIEWMHSHTENIYEWRTLECTYLNGTFIKMHTIDVQMLKLSCWENVILASGISCGVLLLLVLLIVFTYRRRYKLNYLYLQLRAALRHHNQENRDFIFDGFISYSSFDKIWGLETLYAKLASVYGYNICIDDRNFKPGATLTEIIVDTISNSNKIILIISQNFLRSKWCQFEMNLARGELANRGRDCLILILKEPIGVLPPELISPTLRSLLETRVYLEWSDDVDRIDVFWRKLRDALGEPIHHEQPPTDTPFIYANTTADHADAAVHNNHNDADDLIMQCDDEAPLLVN
ncbi:unnamed protein product [Owenia fusiformis]|uniref:TIR domain-containing protein n=1 Tax=Owenia fusiformis TaxID=6347 RepID=A0A8S4PDD9_OWEFU|nr:unnamed protein product [Owenia fusiformis]